MNDITSFAYLLGLISSVVCIYSVYHCYQLYKKESMDILNDNLVTIIIAVVGWVIAIAQSVRNRKLQNANMLAERRAKVYSAFTNSSCNVLS